MSDVIVTIKGPVSSMKTAIARKIAESFKSMGMSATVFDHELFTQDKQFEKSYQRVYIDAKSAPHDVAVVVVGTGVSNDPLDLRVEPAVYGSGLLFRVLADAAYKAPTTRPASAESIV